MRARSNEEWLSELQSSGEEQAIALEDLRAYLRRAAFYSLSQNAHALTRLTWTQIEQLAEDCAQDALLAVLNQLSEFRGDSRFTTWAYKFAINIALVTARRERWKLLSLDQLGSEDGWPQSPDLDGHAERDPAHAALHDEVWEAVREVITRELTDRQRQVLKAIVFDEVPIDEVARQLDSNRNAIYKLLHDTRRKLKAHLTARGLNVSEVLALFDTMT